MGTLDRKKPFGIVSGISEDGHRFEQDGKLFDAQGREMWDKGPPKPYEVTVMEPDPVEPEPKEDSEAEGPPAGEPAEEEATNEGEMTRDDIMAELDKLHIAYNTRARKSVLLEMLRTAQTNQADS